MILDVFADHHRVPINLGEALQILPTQALVPYRYASLWSWEPGLWSSSNPTTLIVGRAVAGAGGSGVAVGVFTMLGFAAPPEKRPQL